MYYPAAELRGILLIKHLSDVVFNDAFGMNSSGPMPPIILILFINSILSYLRPAYPF